MKREGRTRPGLFLLAEIATAGVLFYGGSPGLARGAEELTNIALHKPCFFEPTSNWWGQTDPNDSWQLTDGIVVDPNDPNQWFFGAVDKVVGWVYVPQPVVIRIPLAQEFGAPPRSISGVAFGCGALPDWALFWPFAIQMLVSDDGVTYREVGELVFLSRSENGQPPNAYARWWFRTTGLQTRGRVLALVISSFHSLFVDEIEVYEGDPNNPPPSGPGWQAGELREQYWRWREPRFCVEKRLREHHDLLHLRVLLTPLPPEVRKLALDRLAAAEQHITDVAQNHYPSQTGARMIFPLDLDPNRPIHSDLFRVQALLWREQGLPPLSVWQTGLWDCLSPFAYPTTTPSPHLDVRLVRNEARSACLNLSNATDQPMTVDLRIEGLPGGVNPPYLSVHRVEWTDAKADALYETPSALLPAERIGANYRVVLPAGLHRQVWFTFGPLDLAPGEYLGTLQVVPAVGSPASVPTRLTVYPLTLPAQPSLAAMGYDHTNEDLTWLAITPTNRAAIVSRLREYLVDATMAGCNALPAGQYDSQGNMTVEPNTANFDRWVNLWRGARTFFVYSGPLFGCTDGPVFRAKLSAWANFWATHAIARGLDPSRIMLHIIDEPSQDSEASCIALYAHAVRETGSGLRVMENDSFDVLPEEETPFRNMLDACDVLTPWRPDWLRRDANAQLMHAYYQRRRGQGAELGLYDSMHHVMLLDPYQYYRLQAWTAIRHRLRYIGGWCYTHVGDTKCSWNEYEMRYGNFSPLFIDEHSADPSRHLMALRDGIEDYGYFVLLDQAIAYGEAHGASGTVLWYANVVRNLLPDGVDCNTSYPPSRSYWRRYPGDRGAVERVRLQALDAIMLIKQSVVCWRADLDDDGDVDITDFDIFAPCVSGPANPSQGLDCEAADLDLDGDIDLAEFTVFQGAFRGTEEPPACF